MTRRLQAQIKEIVRDVDPDGRGLVDFKEFVGAMGKDMRDHDNEGDLKAAWNVLDKEKRGFITVAVRFQGGEGKARVWKANAQKLWEA